MHGDDAEEGYLYEEKVEKPWDKGGSGLVTYTDAVHWDSLKGVSKRHDRKGIDTCHKQIESGHKFWAV